MPNIIPAFFSKLYLFQGCLVFICLLTAPAALGQSTTYTYDNNGRVKTVEDTDIGVVTYDYDDAGNLTDRVVTPGGTGAPPTCNGPYLVFTGNSNVFTTPLDICSDPNGDTLTIINAVMTSNNGGYIQISTGGTEVLIADMMSCDVYTADFTITDGNGGNVTDQIEVTRLGC